MNYKKMRLQNLIYASLEEYYKNEKEQQEKENKKETRDKEKTYEDNEQKENNVNKGKNNKENNSESKSLEDNSNNRKSNNKKENTKTSKQEQMEEIKEALEEDIKWHPKLTPEQIEELNAEKIYPGDNEYNMYLWNHGINPFEKDDKKDKEKSEPVDNTKTEKEELKDSEEDKEKEKTKPEDNTKPEGKQKKSAQKNNEIDLNNYRTRNPNSSKSERTSLLKVVINPKNRTKDYYLGKKMGDEIKTIKVTREGLDYSKDYFKSEGIQKLLKECQQSMGEEYKIDAISKNLDPNILELLSGAKATLNEYVRAVYFATEPEKLKLPFKLEYNLDGIKEELSSQERRNLRKITNTISELENASVNKGNRDIWSHSNDKKNDKKDNKKSTLSKMLDKIKATINNRKTRRISDGKEKDNSGMYSKVKNKAVETKDNEKHFVSKRLPRTKRIAKETVGGLKILGTKISGYVRGENPLVTKNKESKIRREAFAPQEEKHNKRTEKFVPRAKVDESKAWNEVEKQEKLFATNNENIDFVLDDPGYYDEK